MTFFEETYCVDSREVDPWGNCRPSGVLGLLQEAATGGAAALNASRAEMMARYQVFWMLARVWYCLERPLRWGEQVTIRTCHRGTKGASFYRDFDLSVDGVPVGEAVSLWVVADAQTHKLARLSHLPEFLHTDGGALSKTRRLNKLTPPPELVQVEDRTFRYSDLDLNGHVNNTRYADVLCDALHLEKLDAHRFLSTLQVNYQAECRAGETIQLFTGTSDGVSYIRGAGQDGKTRFDAAAAFTSIPN